VRWAMLTFASPMIGCSSFETERTGGTADAATGDGAVIVADGSSRTAVRPRTRSAPAAARHASVASERARTERHVSVCGDGDANGVCGGQCVSILQLNQSKTVPELTVRASERDHFGRDHFGTGIGGMTMVPF
jgi:hypothetical protein